MSDAPDWRGPAAALTRELRALAEALSVNVLAPEAVARATTRVAEARALQLLTHPIWWRGRAGRSAQQKLDDFASARADFIGRELAAQCDVYRCDEKEP